MKRGLEHRELPDGDRYALARALRDRVADCNITHRTAAESIGTTPQSFSRWLSGHTIPHPKQMHSIARFLEVPYAEARAMQATMQRFADRADRQVALMDRLDRLVKELEGVTSSSRQVLSILAQLIQLLVERTTDAVTNGHGWIQPD